MPLTSAQMALLDQVNRQANALPYDALPGPGEPPDWYSDEPVAGRSWVCRMYVQLKATALRRAGWPAAELSEVLCWTEPVDGEREYHAVLAVADGPDPCILDSRFDTLYRMSAPPADYRWEARQVAGTTTFAAITA